MSGTVVMNRGAVGDEDRSELQRQFSGHEIVECDADGIGTAVRAALAKGAEFIAVAGGDGTVRAAAQEMRDQQVPLVPAPAGTRNHFARDIGIGTFEAAAAAVRGRPRAIDLGEVNGRCFVNNSSIGLYPELVRVRQARQRHLPKWLAHIVAAYDQVRHGRRIRVDVDGTNHWAWLVFVGNGCYGDELLDLAKRSSLEENLLDVRVVNADTRWSRLRIVAAVLFGRLHLSPIVRVTASRAVVIDVDREFVDVALDGEVERLKPPLEYSSIPRSLFVLAGLDDSPAPASSP